MLSAVQVTPVSPVSISPALAGPVLVDKVAPVPRHSGCWPASRWTSSPATRAAVTRAPSSGGRAPPPRGACSAALLIGAPALLGLRPRRLPPPWLITATALGTWTVLGSPPPPARGGGRPP